ANQQTVTGISNWRTNMESRPWSVYNYQPYRRPQVAKIPDILKIKAKLGVLGLIDDTQKRKIYGEDFPYSLQQELLETNIRINNEGSRSLVLLEEQSLNELKNERSPRQKQFINRQLNIDFGNQRQASDLPQSSVFDDIPPEISLTQEKLSEAQQQQIEADMISFMNLSTVYDIGALDWERPPNNDAYGRHPFETYATSYKYDQFGNYIAYMKKPTQTIGKKNNNMKRNYIPTSQLIQTAKVQADLHKKLAKSSKIGKKK
ncbi:MAG: hypothetical protein EZS28_038841, partial [Streblomastix strix]